MKIIETYNWHRRDFDFKAECEECGQVDHHDGGYDDANYHDNVIPDIKCSACGKSRNDLISEGKIELIGSVYQLKYNPHDTI